LVWLGLALIAHACGADKFFSWLLGFVGLCLVTVIGVALAIVVTRNGEPGDSKLLDSPRGG
jgi:hypothetical protein